MARHVVRFMKDVLGENGHEVEICQRLMEIEAADKLKAVDLAKVKVTVLGRQPAVDFLKTVLRTCTDARLHGTSIRLVRDAIEAETYSASTADGRRIAFNRHPVSWLGATDSGADCLSSC